MSAFTCDYATTINDYSVMKDIYAENIELSGM